MSGKPFPQPADHRKMQRRMGLKVRWFGKVGRGRVSGMSWTQDNAYIWLDEFSRWMGRP